MEIFVIIFFICVIIYFISKTSRHQSQTNHKSIPLYSEQNKYAKTKSININNKNLKLNQNYGSLTLNFIKSNSVSDYIIYFPKRPILNNSKLYPITIVRWLQENGKKFDSQKPVVELRLDNYIAQGVILGFTGILNIGKKAGDSILEGEELCRVSFYNQKTSKQIESTYNNKFDLNNPVNIVPNKSFEDHSNNLLLGIKLLPIKINYLELEDTKNGQGYEYLLNVKDINYFGKNFNNAVVKRWYFKNGDYVLSGAKINELLLDNIYPAFCYSKRSGYLEILKSENQSINVQDLIFKLLPIKLSKNSKSPLYTSLTKTDNQKIERKIEVIEYPSKNSKSPLYTSLTKTDNQKIERKIEVIEYPYSDPERKMEAIEYSHQNPENHSHNLLNGIKLLPIKINYTCKSVGTTDNAVFIYFLNIDEINYFGKHFEQIIIKKWLLKNDDYVSSGMKINELLLDNTYPAYGYADRSGYLKIIHSESKKVNNTTIIYGILPIKSRFISEPIINPTNSVKYQTNEDIIEVDDYNTEILQNKPIENITEEYLKEFWLCLPYPSNNMFINSVPDSENLMDSIYLNIIQLFKEYYLLKGTNILDNLDLTPQRIFQIKKMKQEGSYYNSPDFYEDYSFRYEFVNTFNRVYKIADGIIRIKYGLNSDLKGYLHVLKALKLDKYSEEIENKLIELQNLVPELDHNSEVEINKNYTSRWKNKFQQIKASKEITNDKNIIIAELEELIYNNEKNYTLRSIYFEASKLIYDIDLFKSVWYYSMYKHISKNGNFNSKPLPTIIKKMLSKTDSETNNKLEKVFSQDYKIKNVREVKRLYEDISNILIKPKKKISISKNKIKSAEKEHERIKKKLEKYLTDEVTNSIENTAIVSSIKELHLSTEENENCINLTSVQIDLIKEIIDNKYIISESTIKEFGRKNNLPYNMLIDSINEALFEKFDDNIIYEENSNFYLNSDYLKEINTIIIKNDKI